MSALSDPLESGLLHLLFHGESFTVPTNMSIALTSGVPEDGQTGATIPELPYDSGDGITGYNRIDYSTPSSNGSDKWTFVNGSGFMSNAEQITFNTALKDWGEISGIVILDSPVVGSGQVLFAGPLSKPRNVLIGDSPIFLEDELKVLLG